MFYVISPTSVTDWRFDRVELMALLNRDWPAIEISGPDPSLDARDVVWTYEDDTGELEGSQDREGQAHYLSGPTGLIVRHAIWWRRIVPGTVDLALFDESYSIVVPLPEGITEDEVLQQLTG